MEAKNILYQVDTNLASGIIEIEYLKKTNSFYWLSAYLKRPLYSKDYKTFENKDEAVNYLVSKINQKIDALKYSVEIYEAELEAIKLKYGK